jgi:LPS sulfotransferase NodH
MNQRQIYLIYSPGRTGSHIILESIAGIGNTAGGLCHAQCFWHPNNPSPWEQNHADKNIAIQTHNLAHTVNDLGLELQSTVLILSKRKDKFAQIMSRLTAEITQEWNGKDYSDKPARPQVVDQERLRDLSSYYNTWPGHIDRLSEYQKVVSIYYEDIVERGPIHIAQLLNMDYDQESLGHVNRPSPYCYKDWVSNWKELYDLFCKINQAQQPSQIR